MQRLKEHMGQDFIVCRVNHISLQQDMDDHENKFQSFGIVMGVIVVVMLTMMVVMIHFIMMICGVYFLCTIFLFIKSYQISIGLKHK